VSIFHICTIQYGLLLHHAASAVFIFHSSLYTVTYTSEISRSVLGCAIQRTANIHKIYDI
jgi:hypothetical protein